MLIWISGDQVRQIHHNIISSRDSCGEVCLNDFYLYIAAALKQRWPAEDSKSGKKFGFIV